MHDPIASALRASARTLPASGILAVFNYGRTKAGLIPLWAGEGDLPTPRFICDAAARSLAAGETFYTANRGIPELRQALARYTSRVYGQTFSAEEFFVVGGGMQAIQLATQAIAGPGDEIVVPTPAWPNFAGAAECQGAKAVPAPMALTAEGWTLPLDKLFAACGPRARAIVVNSPSNPTGWIASRAELEAILEFARRRGLWIIADEIYGRFVYEGAPAPTFLELRRPGDLIIFANTFSKNWAMTGWRIGWMQAPPAIGQVIENLVQYNTSGVATFMQRAAIAALEDGEPFLAEQLARARAGRDIALKALAPFKTVRLEAPAGAFYLFFSIDGLEDSSAAALKLVDEANVGLAPGTAFGAGAEPYLRICFLRSAAELTEAMGRLARWLERR
jgi:aspartate/methionine/tyrosine aminotransferase